MAKPLTILHVNASEIMERWTMGSLRLARALQFRGHRILFACRKHSCCEEYAKNLNMQVFDDMKFAEGFPRTDLWHECRLMARRIDIEILDVVHAHGTPEAWITTIGARLATRNPAILRTVTNPPVAGKYPFAQLAMQGLIDHVIVPSAVVFDQIRGFEDFDYRYASLVYQGVDLKRFNPTQDGKAIRKERSIPTDQALIVWAGKPGTGKGEQTLLHAMPRIKAAVPDAALLMACDVDDETDYADLEKQARRLGLSAQTVIFMGRRKDIENVLAASNVVAAPSERPQHGSRIALQTAAVGRPIVACNVSGLADFIQDGVTGSVVPSGDVGALAKALTHLLLDREEARKRGLSGRLLAEQELGEDRMAELVEDLYLRVLESQGGADGYSF